MCLKISIQQNSQSTAPLSYVVDYNATVRLSLCQCYITTTGLTHCDKHCDRFVMSVPYAHRIIAIPALFGLFTNASNLEICCSTATPFTVLPNYFFLSLNRYFKTKVLNLFVVNTENITININECSKRLLAIKSSKIFKSFDEALLHRSEISPNSNLNILF